MIVAVLSSFGLILSIVVMIMAAVVASRIETINVQGHVYILLHSLKAEIAYYDAIVASVFTGVIILIFISIMAIDIVYEDKKENTANVTSETQETQVT